jgi:hypothetical protein
MKHLPTQVQKHILRTPHPQTTPLHKLKKKSFDLTGDEMEATSRTQGSHTNISFIILF